MKVRRVTLLGVVLAALSVAVLGSGLYLAAQAPQGRGAVVEDPPGGITLLPGYQHLRGRGVDSRVGMISNGRGFEIRYDIGTMAGNRASNPRDRVWLKTQVLGGNQVQISFSTDRVLNVTFPATPGVRGPGSSLPANFYAKVTSDEDVVDLLLMAMSYKP
jgi:hypothetical protein